MVQAEGIYEEQILGELRKTRRNRIGPLRHLTSSLRRLPDFIIIGAQKCGTTALYRYLEGHPAVAPALTKEIHFFDNNHERGLNWYRAHFPTSLFRGAGKRVTGESSPSYLVHPLAPERIFAALPGVRLLALVRHPVDRAYSHFQHNARKGREKLSFQEAVAHERKRLDGRLEEILADVEYFDRYYQFSYLLRGIYVEQFRRWLARFPRADLLVIKNEDLLRDPAPTFRRALDFLGLPAWEPEYRIHHHYGYSEMDPEVRRPLLDYFRPHNEQLGQLLGEEFDWDD